MPGGSSNAKSVIASGRRNYAPGRFFGCEPQDLVGRSTQFERPCSLQMFELEKSPS